MKVFRAILIMCVALTVALTNDLTVHAQQRSNSSSEETVRTIVLEFEKGLNERDLRRIEAVVAEDLVVLENGHRNEGWADFRDHHLIPEMKEPAPPSKSEFITIKTSDRLAWAYTRTDMKLTRKAGEQIEARLWSVYVLEKRNRDWKIVLLDWSLYVPNRGAK
jgi:ketosteroid isomerase-like protein